MYRPDPSGSGARTCRGITHDPTAPAPHRGGGSINASSLLDSHQIQPAPQGGEPPPAPPHEHGPLGPDRSRGSGLPRSRHHGHSPRSGTALSGGGGRRAKPARYSSRSMCVDVEFVRGGLVPRAVPASARRRVTCIKATRVVRSARVAADHGLRAADPLPAAILTLPLVAGHTPAAGRPFCRMGVSRVPPLPRVCGVGTCCRGTRRKGGGSSAMVVPGLHVNRW